MSNLFKKSFYNYLVIALSTILLTSCNIPDIDVESKMIDTDPMIHSENLIKQTKERSKRDVQLGPKIDSSKDSVIHKKSRHHLKTELAPSYDKITSLKNRYKVFDISLNVQNMDIRTLMELFSEITGVNFIVSDEVTGVMTAKFKDVPWTNALESILQMRQLAKYVEPKANIIRIHDHSTIIQIEEFEHRRQENMQKALMIKRASEPVHTEVFKLFYTKPDQIKTMLDEVLKNSRTSSGSLRNTDPEIIIDQRKNQLIVRARKDDLDMIAKVIKQVDSRTKQVFIEAFIVEVTDDFQKAFGTQVGFLGSNSVNAGLDTQTVDYSYSGILGSQGALGIGNTNSTISNLGLGAATSGIGVIAGVGSAADLKLELTALEAKGLTKVISNPKVFTLDNQEAIIFQGDEVPYETTSDSGTNIEFKEAGLRLAVTPTVVGDGNLLLNIEVNKDTVDTSQPNPPIRKSEIKTSLVSKDSEIVVIGGIYDENKSQSTDQVPGLGDLPVVGKLFKRKSRQNDRRELMVFIAPKVL